MDGNTKKKAATATASKEKEWFYHKHHMAGALSQQKMLLSKSYSIPHNVVQNKAFVTDHTHLFFLLPFTDGHLIISITVISDDKASIALLHNLKKPHVL